jgi:hypothetical protein
VDLAGEVDYADRMPARPRLLLALFTVGCASAACSTPPAPPPEGGSQAPLTTPALNPTAPTAPTAPPPTTTGSAAAALPPSVPTGSGAAGASDAAPAPSGSADPGGSAGPAAASGAPSAGQEPPASLKVANIGLHIGGGPNDAPTKEPIKRSVEPHFDALRRCFMLVEDPRKGGDFGVDLLIPKDGGRAEVSHPRTALKGEGFQACVVKTFEGVDFKRPKTGKTMVSYSIRYSP